MKKYIVYFLLSMATVTSLSLKTENVQAISGQDSTHVGPVLDKIISTGELPPDTTASEIVLWLLRMLGGFITTLLMALLHKWFPKLFPSAMPRAYKPGGKYYSNKNP